MGRRAEARPVIESLYQDAPTLHYVASLLLEQRLSEYDWRDYERLREVLCRAVAADLEVIPLTFLTVSDDPDAQLRCARRHCERLSLAPASAAGETPKAADRLRVGYLSSDFRHHAVSLLMAGVLECHDRRGFEIFAFSTGADDGSAIRARLASGSEHFIDCAGLGAAAVEARIRELGIHVLVDLNGHTRGENYRVLCRRPAWPIRTRPAFFCSGILPRTSPTQ